MASMRSRVCVIGCGPSGMSFLNHFSQLPVNVKTDIVCYEKQETWGGQWNLTWRTGTDEYGETVHSSIYNNLWINIPKEAMEFPDFTFQKFIDKPLPSYTPASFIRKYLEARMIHNSKGDVSKCVRYSTVVRRVQYNADTDDFSVIVHNLKTDRDEPVEKFTHVVVASGIFSTPNVPKIPGIEQFKGRILHAHNFRESREFNDKKILIIGDSYSAQDLALQTMKFGALSVICSWKTKPMGYVWPKGISERPLVQKFQKNTVFFKDGFSTEVDVILFCTGYKLHFPFLPDDLRLSAELSFYPKHLYKGIVWMNGGNGKLLYIGAQNQRYTFPMFEAQAFWICKYISGDVKLPSKQVMAEDADRWRRQCEQIKSVPEDIEFQAAYISDLCNSARFPSKLADLRDMLNVWNGHRLDNMAKFRDHQFDSQYSGVKACPLDTAWMEIFDDREEIFS